MRTPGILPETAPWASVGKRFGAWEETSCANAHDSARAVLQQPLRPRLRLLLSMKEYDADSNSSNDPQYEHHYYYRHDHHDYHCLSMASSLLQGTDTPHKRHERLHFESTAHLSASKNPQFCRHQLFELIRCSLQQLDDPRHGPHERHHI